MMDGVQGLHQQDASSTTGTVQQDGNPSGKSSQVEEQVDHTTGTSSNVEGQVDSNAGARVTRKPMGHGGSRHGVQPAGRKDKKKAIKKPDPPTISVLFVDQTKGGILAKRLQEAEHRLAGMTGYRVRVTESCGSKLCRVLPNTNPWQGEDCTRLNCFTCGQGGDKLENCKQRNVLYESFCTECNPEDLKDGNGWRADGVYVGETARSIFERALEHHGDAEGRKEDRHRIKHWVMDHPTPP